jgi:uncharacterized lipoprotein YddW (UPF0748 family)
MISRPSRSLVCTLFQIVALCLCVMLTSNTAHAHLYRHHALKHIRMRRERAERATYRPLESRSAIWDRGAAARVPVRVDMHPVQEVRGLWVVRNSIETPEQIRNMVATAKANGFNTLFVQVRGRGDAWYQSSLEPRAEELDSAPASFDPLQTVITDAHAAGLQVHAWVNMMYVWSAGRLPESPEHIVNAHTDWLSRDEGGGFRLTADDSCEGAYLAPSNAEVRQHLHDVILDIVNRYDVDGIHYDYIRYPNSDYDHSQAAETAFADTMRPTLPSARAAELDNAGPAAYLHAFPDAWADWRRDQITSLVEWISKDVKTAKPWVCVSAAVFANYDDAYNARGQDWKRWLKDGALDAVVPMAYASSTQLVADQIRDAANTAKQYGRACYAGLGSWHISPSSTVEKIEAARSAGAQGIVLFSYGGVTDYGSSTAYLSEVESDAFAAPASLPKLASVAPRSAPIAASPS